MINKYSNKEIQNATVGALTGLGLGLLARKLVAGDQDVGWGDYLTWGGIGAGLGGVTGYGLTNVDTSKPSADQISDLEEKVESAKTAVQEAVAKGGEVPGLFQSLRWWDWLSNTAGQGALILAHKKLNSKASAAWQAMMKNKKVKKALNQYQDSVTRILRDKRKISKARRAAFWDAIRHPRTKLKPYLASTFDIKAKAKSVWQRLTNPGAVPPPKSVLDRRLIADKARLRRTKLDYADAVKAYKKSNVVGLLDRALLSIKGARGAGGVLTRLALHTIPHLIPPAITVIGNDKVKGWWNSEDKSLYNPDHSDWKDATDELAKLTEKLDTATSN